jgi:DNA-binding PadR family transcriptional regulator
MSMELINNLQATILEHLGRFGFLAVSQFHVLTGKSVGYLREMLGSLSRRGYIKSYRVEVSYKVRAENIYFLTPLGKEFLLSHKNVFADDIKIPVSSNPVVVKDYFHRLAFVNTHIAIYQYLQTSGVPLAFFYTYFDKTGSVKKGNLAAKTKVPLDGYAFYIPDGVFVVANTLYLLEMYCDRDTKRIINQLGVHAKAIALGTPAKAFSVAANPYVLSVFAHDGIKEAVIKRLKAIDGFTQMKHLFYFTTLEDLQHEFTSWRNIDNAPLNFI